MSRPAEAVQRVIKAYDVRGLVGEEIDEAFVRDVGAAFARLVRDGATKVVIGHSGDSTDLDYLEELIAQGSYLGMDRFGIDSILPFEQRVDTVAQMCERGHAEKMVLSHDASCYFDALPEDVVPVVMPNWHYLLIHNDVIPALKQRGVTDEQLHTMLVDNPRRIFTHGGGY